jgi:hypothetical protein
MKYYSEEETKDPRLAFEEKVLSWPQVSTKKMFGCPCYQVESKLFVFLVTKGIVITQLEQADGEEISRQHQTTSFHVGKKTVQNWVRLSIKSIEELDNIMPFVRKSYKEALQKAKP